MGWLLLAPAAPQAQQSGQPVEARLRATVAHLLALPASARDDAALAAADLVLDNAPEALALHEHLEQPAERRELLRLMAVTGNRAFLPALHRALAESGESELLALRATAALAVPASAPYVAPFLDASEPGHAALALRYYAVHPDLLPARVLPKLLQRRERPVRVALLPVLGARREEGAWQACGIALEEDDDGMRAAAVDCLAALGGPEATRRLLSRFDTASPPLQGRMVGAVLRAEPQASFPRLVVWLRHPQPTVALAALVALQVQGDPRRVPALMARLEEGAPALPPDVIIKALGLSDDPRAVPFLGQRLRQVEATFRTAAPPTQDLRPVLIEALGALGRLEGQQYLAPYLSSYDRVLRDGATDALRRIAAARR